MPALLFPPAQSNLDGVQVSGTPAVGEVLTATSATAADWAYVSGRYLSANAYVPPSQVTFTTTSATMAALAVAGLTVASGSNGGEISAIATWSSPSAGVLDVSASTASYPSSGTLTVAASGSTTAVITYTGISGSTFTGCAYVSGSPTGTVATGGAVALSGISISTGSFTAPFSGNVIVHVSLAYEMSATGVAFAFGLAAHGTVTPILGYETILKAPVATTAQPLEFDLYASLTPGTTYNLDLLWAVASSDTLSVIANSQTGTSPTLSNAGVGQPVVITVQAV